MKPARFILLLAGLTLLAPGGAPAAALYRMQPITHLGDKLGGLPIRTRQGFWVGSLNDSGQIVFCHC